MTSAPSSLLLVGIAAFLPVALLVLSSWGAQQLLGAHGCAAYVAGVALAVMGVAFFTWAVSPISQTDAPPS